MTSNIIIIIIIIIIVIVVIIVIILALSDNNNNNTQQYASYGEKCVIQLDSSNDLLLCQKNLTCTTDLPNSNIGICKKSLGQACSQDNQCTTNLSCQDGFCQSIPISTNWQILQWSRPLSNNSTGNWSVLYDVQAVGKNPCLTSYNNTLIYAPDVSTHSLNNYTYYLLENNNSPVSLIVYYDNTDYNIIPYNIHFLSNGKITILVQLQTNNFYIYYILYANLNQNVLTLINLPSLSQASELVGSFPLDIPKDFSFNSSVTNLALLFYNNSIYTNTYPNDNINFPLPKAIKSYYEGINIEYSANSLAINSIDTILFENKNYGAPFITNLAVSQSTPPEALYIQHSNIKNNLHYIINTNDIILPLIINNKAILNISSDLNNPNIYILST